MEDIIIILIIGVMTGISAGMFGIGGSVIATPLLYLTLPIGQLAALATPLPTAIPSAMSGSIIYGRNGLIDYKKAFAALSTAIPIGWLSSYFSDLIDPTFLLVAKAAFLIFLGLEFCLDACSDLIHSDIKRDNLAIFFTAGALAGLISGLLAVGGGIVMVTVFQRVSHMPMKNAVASSLFCVGILALANSAAHISLGHIDIRIALIMTFAVIPSALLGAKLAVKLKNKILERIFGAAMIIFAIVFIIFQYKL